MARSSCFLLWLIVGCTARLPISTDEGTAGDDCENQLGYCPQGTGDEVGTGTPAPTSGGSDGGPGRTPAADAGVDAGEDAEDGVGDDRGADDGVGDDGADGPGDEGLGDDGPGDDGAEGVNDDGAEGAVDEGGLFPPVPDVGGDQRCSLWRQNCPEGEACKPYDSGSGTWDAARCVPLVDNPKAIGDACVVLEGRSSGIDDCDQDGLCWYTNTQDEGTCTPFCQGSPLNPRCDDPDASCIRTNDGAINLCLGACDPLLQDCPSEQACQLVTDAFVCTPSWVNRGVGEPCAFVNSCTAGLTCVDASSVPGCADETCCTPFCDVDEPSCPAMTLCAALFEPGQAPDDLDHVGICVGS